MKARHTLADMQGRISRSAYDALGITAGDVGPEHVRAAFLQLTKTYHPAKFARMSTEIQKLANEVFLGLRAAHDQLAKPKPAQRSSGPVPTILPSKTPPTDLQRNASGVRPNLPPTATSSLNPPTQRGVQPAPATPRPSTAQPARPGTAPATPRPTATPPTATSQPIRRLTPMGGVPVVKPATPTRPPTAPVTSTTSTSAEPELAGVYDQLQKGQWEPARTTLNALIALQPKPRYKALLQYSIGREAQLAQRVNEARVELQGALEIDPDLQLAKTALGELFTRRK